MSGSEDSLFSLYDDKETLEKMKTMKTPNKEKTLETPIKRKNY